MKKLKRCKWLLTLVLGFALLEPVMGQQITGKVADQANEPIVGATVAVEGTTMGALTDENGEFAIQAAPDAVLRISYPTFETLTVLVEGLKYIEAKMIAIKQTDEVVVIGYGEVRRKDLTGSVSKVSSEALNKVRATTFEGGLQAQSAGVQVVATEGGPDAGFRVRIRGATSINASSDPLYVIDGFPISGSNLNTSAGFGNSSTSPLAGLDPANIQSIEVLKDAAATAIYGSRGANGVVLITTKQGQRGQANLTFESFTSISTLSSRIDVLTPQEFIDFRNDFQPYNDSLDAQKRYLATSYRVLDSTLGDSGMWVPVDINDPQLIIDDWTDNITQNALTQYYRLAANGGGVRNRYSATVSYLNREGIIKTSGIERITADLNVSQRVTPRIRTGLNLNVGYTLRSGIVSSSSQNNQGRAGIITSAILFSPVQPVRHPENEETLGQLGIEFDDDGRMIRNQNGDIANPVVLLNENTNDGRIMQGRFNTFAEFNLAKGLTFRSTIRGFSNFTKNKAYFSERVGWAQATGGQASVSVGKFESIVFEQNLNYRKQFKNSRVEATLVAENQRSAFEWLATTATGFELPGLNVDALGTALQTLPTNSSLTTNSLISYLARVQYGAMDKYLLTVSARYDGSSRFAENRRWGFFPAVG